jgi:hypothetical protein
MIIEDNKLDSIDTKAKAKVASNNIEVIKA